MFSTTIETERLILRPFKPEDITHSYRIEQDPEVNRYTNDGGTKTLQQVTSAIENGPFKDYVRFGYGRFAVELKSTGAFIGFSGLKFLPEVNRTDLGYRFERKHWGKGYATEAGKASLQFGFETLDLPEIIASILPANSASQHVLQKLGFSFEQEVFDFGEVQWIYCLTKEEWQPH